MQKEFDEALMSFITIPSHISKVIGVSAIDLIRWIVSDGRIYVVVRSDTRNLLRVSA